MTHPYRIPRLLAVVLLAACADGATSPAARPALEAHAGVARVCQLGTEYCEPVSALIDVVAIDIGDAYIDADAGGEARRYHVSWATRFLPVALPPNPIIPTDPVYGTVTSWNALVESQAGYRAFLGQLRQLPPSPILPPNPIRFQVEALFDGTDYFLASLRPVLTP